MVYIMTSHLFLDIVIALGLVLALAMKKKYAVAGLVLLILSLSTAGTTAYAIDGDIVQAIICLVAALGAIYELIKAIRGNYKITRKAKILTGAVFTLLGGWYAALGVLSPFLIAGVVIVAKEVIGNKQKHTSSDKKY